MGVRCINSEGDRPIYKIIQWATGNVGTASLRSILVTPDYQLVGAYVYSPDKSGRDVGELCGLGPVGVLTTSDPDAVLALEADCVVFNALGDTRDPAESEDAICRLLASGKNVVSTAVSSHIHPKRMAPEVRARIEAACRQGGVSFHSSGINPGFAFDVLPIQLSAVCDRIDHIHCVELVDMAHYSSRQIVHDAIGMGQRPDRPGAASLARQYRDHPYYVCALLIEEAFGITFDNVVVSLDKAVTDRPVQCPWGVVEPGTVAAQRMRLEGLLRGKVLCTWDVIWRVSNDVAPDWPSGDSSWEVNIAGEPDMHCRLDLKAAQNRTVSLVTSMHAANQIRAVVAAEPGIVTRLDLPLTAGGRFAA
jgi:4-hydroxy-tetrahydrodipicolinate reductase